MTKTIQSMLFRERRLHPGDMAFAVIAVGCFVAGLGLLFLPQNRIDGPSLAAIYDTLPAQMLGMLWFVAGVFPAWAVIRPSVAARERVYIVLLPLATGWTGGLFIPIVTREVSNFWAPLVWAVLTCLGYIAYWLIPLESAFYRKAPERATPRHI